MYALGDPSSQSLHTVEQPGRYCFPPLAALIAGAARLMLAILGTCVAEFGGCHVMADTDSMAIVAKQRGSLIACNGGPRQLPDGTPAVYALSRSQVEAIVARFGSLSPYDRDLIESVLKIEDVNYDKRGTGCRCTGSASAPSATRSTHRTPTCGDPQAFRARTRPPPQPARPQPRQPRLDRPRLPNPDRTTPAPAQQRRSTLARPARTPRIAIASGEVARAFARTTTDDPGVTRSSRSTSSSTPTSTRSATRSVSTEPISG